MPSGMPKIINTSKKVIFISDLHLGAPNYEASLEREKLFIRWINQIKGEISHLFLLGDIYDAWFEYKHVIPAKFTRFLGKCAELTDLGIQVYFMSGNHDLWIRSFMKKELGIQYLQQPTCITINDIHFQLAHGDGMVKEDWFYKIVKKYIYTNPLCIFLYRQIHPDIGLPLARYFSSTSREVEIIESKFEDRILKMLENKHSQRIDYYVFGHVHKHIIKQLKDATYVNLGSWYSEPHYLELNEKTIQLKSISC